MADMKKTTVLFIHGGHMYPTHEDFLENLESREVDLDRMRKRDRWYQHLQEELGESFDVLYASMPTSDDAHYEEWKLWYERLIDAIGHLPFLVGHSLGAMFLVKYYSENTPAKPVPGVFLVAGRYDPIEQDLYSHTSFTHSTNPSVLTERAEHVAFFHSKDDPVVPYESFEHYRKLVPGAAFHTFTDRGHFLDERFPEIVAEIRATVEKQ